MRSRSEWAIIGTHQWMYTHSGGLIGHKMLGRTMLVLTHVGAKTGTKRTSALLYARDGHSYGVIASKGGSRRNPGWYHNLMANPDAEIQVGRTHVPVHARAATEDERARVWASADRMTKGRYERYQTRTQRRIPVVMLEPR